MTAPTAMKEFLSVNRLAFAAISTSEKDNPVSVVPTFDPCSLSKRDSLQSITIAV